jgi:hypothetical protein
VLRSFLLAVLLALPAVAQPTPIHDLVLDFLYSWEQTQGQPEAERIQFMREHVFDLAPELYGPLFAYGQEYNQEDPETRIRKHLRQFPFLEPQFRTLYNGLKPQLERHLRTFRYTFPDFEPRSVDIYLAHSLGASNGGLFPHNGRTLFYLGLDMMTLHNRYENQAPFFHHELFHAYHLQKWQPDDRFFSQLWMEGLAVHVARTMHPNATLPELQLSEALIRQSQPRLPALLDEIEANLETEDRRLNHKFFNLESKDEQVPVRSGYYLGYLLVREIAPGRSLTEMAEMQTPQILANLRRVLPTVKARPPHESLLPPQPYVPLLPNLQGL